MAIARFAAAATLAVTVGACSDFRLSNDGPRTPSMRVADAALSSGAPDLALRVADLTLDNDPHNLPALIAKGDALYALGRNEAAQEAYRSAIDIDPTAAAAQLGFGRTLVKSDPAGAEAAFLAALRSNTTSIAALNNLGVARDMLRRSTEAQEAYHLALSISPDSPDVKINLGRSLALAGRDADAAAVLRQVAADPEATQHFHDELAAALALAGDRTPVQQKADGGRSPAGLSEPVQVATAPLPRVARETLAAPAKEQRQVAVTTSLPPQIAEVAEATAAVPLLPDVSRTTKPERHPEPAAMEGHSDLEPFVQLASLLSEPDATFEWQRLTRRMPELLSDRKPTITAFDTDDKRLWRLRTFGFVSLQDARNFCARLIDAGWKCRTGLGL